MNLNRKTIEILNFLSMVILLGLPQIAFADNMPMIIRSRTSGLGIVGAQVCIYYYPGDDEDCRTADGNAFVGFGDRALGLYKLQITATGYETLRELYLLEEGGDVGTVTLVPLAPPPPTPAPTPPPPPPPPPAPDRSITGWIDGVQQIGSSIWLNGWACAKTSNASIAVHVYAGGPAGQGTIVGGWVANVRSETAVAQACNASGTAYRFSIPLDNYQAQFVGRPLYVHGISPFGLPNLYIGNSGNIVMPTPPDRSITGWMDRVVQSGGAYFLTGWACSKTSNASIAVHLYAGGPAGQGTIVGGWLANQASEPAVAQACGASGNAYRYSIPLDSYRAQFKGKALYVHGISTFGLPNLLLNGSGVLVMP